MARRADDPLAQAPESLIQINGAADKSALAGPLRWAFVGFATDNGGHPQPRVGFRTGKAGQPRQNRSAKPLLRA
ncbi:hypothetical protein [Geopseudomonas sagittaria]|jgi:hypothetical protein|uniref:hypothetical protein n=1 Tax=Geopseudomonas sagittaria TaxID=1135990 RepID=UPI000B887977|nr:hypothetical protein [Pseudomonas sagittaria]